MIEITGLSKYYGSYQALKNINLSIARGTVMGLLGPNGAGKTTLMRIITGYMSSTSGSCTVNGYEVHASPISVQNAIGYLPEHPPLYLEMTVREYLEFVSRLKKIPVQTKRDRIDYVIEAVFIKDRFDQIIGTLSKGYRQRVGLAAAIIHDPQVLILDEPTVGLDPNQISEIRRLIRTLCRDQQRTAILSTHILPEVSATCDRVAIIHQGTLVAEDTQEHLQEKLSGGSAMRITLAADADRGRALIAESVSVHGVEREGSSIIVHDPELSGKRMQIVRTLVEQGLDITDLRADTLSLEEVFRKLTISE